MEYSPLDWMGATPTTLKKLNTIQDKAAPLDWHHIYKHSLPPPPTLSSSSVYYLQDALQQFTKDP